MKHARQLIVIGVVVIFVIIMLVTNPSQEEHMSTIRGSQDSVVGTGLAIAGEALGAFEYHNYVLFSTVTSGEDRISLGLLGKVWVDSDDQ